MKCQISVWQQTAVSMKQVTSSLQGVVGSMQKAMESMNLVQMSELMEKFEKQFEDLDVQTATMDDAMKSTTTATTPESQVDLLMQQVADEHGLEFNADMQAAPIGGGTMSVAAEEQSDLSERLAKLRADN